MSLSEAGDGGREDGSVKTLRLLRLESVSRRRLCVGRVFSVCSVSLIAGAGRSVLQMAANSVSFFAKLVNNSIAVYVSVGVRECSKRMTCASLMVVLASAFPVFINALRGSQEACLAAIWVALVDSFILLSRPSVRLEKL